MVEYLPSIAYYTIMSGTGIEFLLGAVTAISTIKTTVSSAKYAYEWIQWARQKKEVSPDNHAWQWIESDDEFEIEYVISMDGSSDQLDGKS